MAKTTVDKSDPIPRYLQVRRILEESIRSGRYAPGARLPGERELAQTLQVSQMTVNKALLSLAHAGWLRREVGKGTFVPEDFRPPAPPIARIGFAVPTSTEHLEEDYYLGSLLRGIQRAIINMPISLTILETPVETLYSRIMDAPVDGCLLTDVLDRNLEDVQRLAREGKRLIILSADREPLHIPFVDSDNYGGARAAMSHLLELGHRRIAGVFAYVASCNTRHRLRAYRDMLAAHSITLPDRYLVTFGNIYPLLEPLHARVVEILHTPPRPTAFFCGGYYLALEVMKAVGEEGLRIPGDVSVVGFDDPVSARYLSPPLTTVRQPLEEMGRHAMLKMSRWLLYNEEPPLREVLPARLVVRGSASRAPIIERGSDEC
jgi:DNA-binding LacI/PurR family transcriptional regulator